MCSELVFQDSIRVQNLVILSKQILSVFRNFYEMKFKVSIKFTYFWNSFGQFLSINGNFILLIGSDKFPILPGIECSSIRKFGTKSKNIVYFVSFWRKNNVLTQSNRQFKNMYCRKSPFSTILSPFWELSIKIANFAGMLKAECA